MNKQTIPRGDSELISPAPWGWRDWLMLFAPCAVVGSAFVVAWALQ